MTNGSSTRPTRRPLIVALIGALVLVVGLVVFVFGRSAASSASDDRERAHQQLTAQRISTKKSQQCHAALQSKLPAAVGDAQALFATAAQLGTGEDQLIAAFHDMQVAGTQLQPGPYNSARAREANIADSNNAMLNTATQQGNALQQDISSVRDGCPSMRGT